MKEEPIHLTEVKKIYLKSLEKGMSREELRNLRDDADLKLVEEKTRFKQKRRIYQGLQNGGYNTLTILTS